MRSYPGFCRSKQLEYNPGLTHRCRAGHPRANRRTSDRPSFCGVRPSCSRVIMSCHIFQSTHPLRGATVLVSVISLSAWHFNPRTPCGVRLVSRLQCLQYRGFQSTHPLRGATLPDAVRRDILRFQSTHPLRGATREGQISVGSMLFQSTHPLRGATVYLDFGMEDINISIHAPLAGCDGQSAPARWRSPISIHAPLAGCDWLHSVPLRPPYYFNPRTPCGVRPGVHPAAGDDGYFNPRTPCGVRRSARPGISRSRSFQSTHPLRGATVSYDRVKDSLKISIHAPLAGCDHSGPAGR